jgi:hypothetical protein
MLFIIRSNFETCFALFEYLSVFVHFSYFRDKLGLLALLVVILGGQSGTGASYLRLFLPVNSLQLVNTHCVIGSQRFV